MMRLLLWALMVILVVVYFGTDPRHALKGLTAGKQDIYRSVDDNGIVSYSTTPPAPQSTRVETTQSGVKAAPKNRNSTAQP